MRRPPALAPGARVALVCPSGPLAGPDDLDRAQANARAMGWEPVPGQWVLARDGYLAGTDQQRLDDLNAALRDDSIDGIWCVRGGYGSMRLLEGIEYSALRRRPRALMGYSDITALHSAIGMRCDLVTYHAPVARGDLTPFTRASLERAVVQRADSCGRADGARTLRGGRVRGRVVGGNLALLAALAGTAFAPNYDRAIIVIEDVNEDVYRIERMLLTLRLGDAFATCVGLVFGAFTNTPAERPDHGGSRPLDAVLQEIADQLGIPCISGAPVGHIADQWTVPLGAEAELDADSQLMAAE
ncbi:MAG: LD-carboxypeptidase [Gemmatimonadaceae bacterium]|nr:LD-carboxypeptidase [Gemmatimonadaceae bacterium]